MSSLPKNTKKGPYTIEVESGKTYHWCTCGLSKAFPFCDGSHRGTGYKSLRFTPEKNGIVKICGCQATKTQPYCDGSHTYIQND